MIYKKNKINISFQSDEKVTDIKQLSWEIFNESDKGRDREMGVKFMDQIKMET